MQIIYKKVILSWDITNLSYLLFFFSALVKCQNEKDRWNFCLLVLENNNSYRDKRDLQIRIDKLYYCTQGFTPDQNNNTILKYASVMRSWSSLTYCLVSIYILYIVKTTLRALLNINQAEYIIPTDRAFYFNRN